MTNQDKKNIPDGPGVEKLANSGLFDKIIFLDFDAIINQNNICDIGIGETIFSDGIYIKTKEGYELYNCNYFMWSKPLLQGDVTSPYRTILALTPGVEENIHIIDEIIEKGKFVKTCHDNVLVYPTIISIR